MERHNRSIEQSLCNTALLESVERKTGIKIPRKACEFSSGNEEFGLIGLSLKINRRKVKF
jgi:hypothetical protein